MGFGGGVPGEGRPHEEELRGRVGVVGAPAGDEWEASKIWSVCRGGGEVDGGAVPGRAKGLEECHWANVTLSARAAVACVQ